MTEKKLIETPEELIAYKYYIYLLTNFIDDDKQIHTFIYLFIYTAMIVPSVVAQTFYCVIFCYILNHNLKSSKNDNLSLSLSLSLFAPKTPIFTNNF